MISIASLWLPILLSAVFVFIASSIIHMVLPWHKGDFRKTPDEDGVMNALRPFGIPPGDYMLPRAGSMADCNSPEFKDKLARGPVLIYTVIPNGQLSMGKSLVLWFLYVVVIAAIAAYLASKTVPAAASYHRVFGVVGVASFLGFSGALAPNSIWYSRSWLTTFKCIVDGAIYAALVAGTFGWLWPK